MSITCKWCEDQRFRFNKQYRNIKLLFISQTQYYTIDHFPCIGFVSWIKYIQTMLWSDIIQMPPFLSEQRHALYMYLYARQPPTHRWLNDNEMYLLLNALKWNAHLKKWNVLNKFGLHADRPRIWKHTLPVLWVGCECYPHILRSQHCGIAMEERQSMISDSTNVSTDKSDSIDHLGIPSAYKRGVRK